MSVGYDLRGIQSAPVQAFIDGMLDASALVERLRAQIPDEYAHLRDLPFRTRLADTLTLSTFHGCPPDEIEKIIDWLLRDKGLHCIVKLNPTLLGKDEVRGLLGESLGYQDCHVPDSAFESDTKWEQAQGIVERLGATADALGLSFGVKFTNTLIVTNHRGFFPTTEQQMYLSGQPLHVIAVSLVRKFRQRFGDRFPISFSAGIDRKNFADAMALGLTPITVCSDLLKPGGYARGGAYLPELVRRMDAAGATTIDEFVVKAYGNAGAALAGLEGIDAATRAACAEALASGGDLAAAAGEAVWAQWVSACRLANTETYVAQARQDARYSQAKNSKPPRKLGSMLELFDCVTCDKCIPVCPNDANFLLEIPPTEVAKVILVPQAGGWASRDEGVVTLEMKHQIGNFADACNECGNCDVFCPEDGGPYIEKPRLFESLGAYLADAPRPGFFVHRKPGGSVAARGRWSGREVELLVSPNGSADFWDGAAELRFDSAEAAAPSEARILAIPAPEGHTVPVGHYHALRALVTGLFAPGAVSWVTAMSAEAPAVET
jgi:putative selenate reductase